MRISCPLIRSGYTISEQLSSVEAEESNILICKSRCCGLESRVVSVACFGVCAAIGIKVKPLRVNRTKGSKRRQTDTCCLPVFLSIKERVVLACILVILLMLVY